MDNNSISREEFQNEMSGVKQDISNLYSKVNDVDRRATTIEAVLTNLKDLPNTISNLNTTLALMQQSLESLNEKFDKHVKDSAEKDVAQDARIKQMDENSKIDIVKAIKDNWWKLCVAVAAVLYVVEPYIKNLISQNAV